MNTHEKKKILIVFYPLNSAIEFAKDHEDQFAPHHYWLYDQLKETYLVDVLKTNHLPNFWNKIGAYFGINVLQQQIDCLKSSKKYDLILIPFMDFSFLIALLKILGLFKKKTIAIAHLSYVPQNKNLFKKLKSNLIRNIYLKGHDTIIYYCKPLFEDNNNYDRNHNAVFVDNWGVDQMFFKSFQAEQEIPPQMDYIYTTGGTKRDFPTLIDAFREIQFKLKITTVGNMAGLEHCHITPNIIIDNSLPFGQGSTGLIRKEYYHSLAVAIPLIRAQSYVPFGITVLMEALSMSKAVIATRNPGFPFDLEKEKAGFLIEYGDVEGWRQAIQFVIDHPGEAWEMGNRGARLIANKYDYRIFGSNVDRLVAKMLKPAAVPM